MRWNGSWVRYRVMEITVALLAVSSIIYFVDNMQQRSRDAVPAENWFRVNNIYVPDFRAGEQPNLTYDRTVVETFQGFWVVEFQRLDPATGAFVPICSGSGINDYDPSKFIPNNIVKMEWFVGKACTDLPPGNYRLRGSWSLRRPGWPEKSLVTYSNVFRVAAR